MPQLQDIQKHWHVDRAEPWVAAAQSTMFGLEVMKLDAHAKIDRVIGFRQLTRHELEEYVKPEFRQQL